MHSQYLRHRDNSDSIVLDDDAVQIEASTSTKRSIRHPRFFMSDQKVTLRVSACIYDGVYGAYYRFVTGNRHYNKQRLCLSSASLFSRAGLGVLS